MDRCAVLVDAGYLLGAAAALLDDDADRAALSVDYPALIGTLIEEAEKQTSLPILRVLWYDGAIKGRPTPEHQALGLLPNVKVRLGETVWRHGRLEQKGWTPSYSATWRLWPAIVRSATSSSLGVMRTYGAGWRKRRTSVYGCTCGLSRRRGWSTTRVRLSSQRRTVDGSFRPN